MFTKRILTLTAILALAAPALAVSTAWINEFHYDNDGTDTGEFIEVVLPAADSPGDYSVTLYNGSDQEADDTHSLSTFTAGDSTADYAIYYKQISGIQNGAPDGFSLDFTGTAVQFLSYEGTFTAVDGPAAGMTSINVGVEEGGSTLSSESLQLTGTGTEYADFIWVGPSTATMGSLNVDQTIGELGGGEIPEPMTMFAGLIGLAATGRYLRKNR